MVADVAHAAQGRARSQAHKTPPTFTHTHTPVRGVRTHRAGAAFSRGEKMVKGRQQLIGVIPGKTGELRRPPERMETQQGERTSERQRCRMNGVL